MTRTAYILSSSTLSTAGLDFVSDNFKNIFDIIIDKKAKISLLKMGFSEGNLLKITRFINTLKRTDFGKRGYLYTPDILNAFDAGRSVVESLKGTDENLMNMITKIYSGNLYIPSTTLLTQIMNSCDSFIEEIKKDDTYIKELILFYLFHRKRISTDVFYEEIEKYLNSLKINFPKDFSLMGTVIELIQDKYILTEWGKYVFPSNAFYSQPVKENVDSFKDYLDVDFYDKGILEKLFSGMSESSISRRFGYDVETIKQILDKYSFIFKDTYEYEVYSEVFEKYEFSKEDFTYLFDEEDDTYNFLSAICHKGDEKLTYSRLVSDGLFNKLKVPLEKTRRFLINEQANSDNEDKSPIESFVESHKEMIFRNETLYGMYNHYASPENKIKSVRTVESIIAESRYVISPQYRKFRYYDFHAKETYIPRMQNIVGELSPGNYSTYKIFTDYPDLMSDMDIKNPYELYDFMSKNGDKFRNFVSLSKAPTFYVQMSNKHEFVEIELSKFNGGSKDDFVKHVHDKFGLNSKRFSAYLDFNFNDYNFSEKSSNGNLIDNSTEEITSHRGLDNDTFDLIKSKLTDAIYLKEKFEKVVNAHTTLNDSIVRELNYKKTGDVYFSNKFNSLTETLIHLISESDFENKLYDDVMKSSSVKNGIHDLQSEFRVFQIEKGTYCTMDYMMETGIDIFDVRSFIRTIKKMSGNYEFFSIHSIFDDINDDKLSDYCFDEIFYDDIINYSNVLNVVKRTTTKGLRVYSSKEYSLDDFIKHELNNMGGKSDIDDFINSVKDEYKTYFAKQTVINHVQYYAEDLETVYNNKNNYYDDIYGG